MCRGHRSGVAGKRGDRHAAHRVCHGLTCGVYEAQIRPRSGLAVKHGIGLINSPGTIDADYRGEVMIAVINLGPRPYTFHRGDRVAQMIINRVHQAESLEVEHLDETRRNTGGFGHTGK